ncbi:cell wall metabolism sensor histidine kinase WalK [Mucilaginibacter galii]
MSTRYLLILCITAVAGVFVLQYFWIRNYYFVNKATFEKEVNLAMEDAVKKEFIVRCDTIEQRVLNLLNDTNEFIIKNQYNIKQKRYLLTVMDKRHPADSSSFLSDTLTKVLLPGDTAYRNKITRYFARSVRVTELESRFYFYHTQKLGKFTMEQVRKLDFDTARLRPILTKFLAEREIYTPFKFSLRFKDSIFNKSNFSTALLTLYPIITKAHLTYKNNKKDHYVRAMFINPSGYIVSKLGFMVGGSLVLVLMVGFSLFYLLRSLLTEKKLSAIKNDFISNITHEFKTPIASVSAAVEALSGFNVLDDREKTQRYLNHSKNELQRLSTLVDKVLNSTLYERQDFAIQPESINVDDTIKAILQNHTVATTKTVHYSYANHSHVQTLQADRLYFEHALSNVIDNAIKYSGNEVKIEVTCTMKSNLLAIAVCDYGAGISSGNLGLVFEKFYRVPTGNRHEVKGHGLGLSYVKSIAERHGGSCHLQSEPGKGTTLTLNWPV